MELSKKNRCTCKGDTEQCENGAIYGDYCKRHRSLHLLQDGLIRVDRFSNKESDYYLKDVTKFCISCMGIPAKQLKGTKKTEKFKMIQSWILVLQTHMNHISQIIRIQALYRRHKVLSHFNQRKLCNNEEDFYSFDSLTKIHPLYFYSFVDETGFRWGFDIRSLDKLIQDPEPRNPYTRICIQPAEVVKIKQRIQDIKKQAPYEDIIEIIIRDRKASIKQKAVDLFSRIEQSGYTCHIDWFFALSLRRLQLFYKEFEDVWNYQAQLTPEMKCIIAPPQGIVFTTSIGDIWNMREREDVQEKILDALSKFTHAGDANAGLGYMYFLIAFGRYSQPCYLAHCDWLSAVHS